MNCCRSRETDTTNSSWRLANRSVLVECGVPVDVIRSDRRWNYVLQHGCDHYYTGWSPEWITKEQATRLQRLLDEELDGTCCEELVALLRQRVEDSQQEKPARPTTTAESHAVAWSAQD